jgi:hypothetical protein
MKENAENEELAMETKAVAVARSLGANQVCDSRGPMDIASGPAILPKPTQIKAGADAECRINLSGRGG